MDTLKFVWPCGSPLIFFVSFILLIINWEMKVIRLAGLYAILPGINMAVANLLISLTDFKETILISAIIDFIFIIPIVFSSRNLYTSRYFVPWLLLVFETFRSVMLLIYYFSSRSRLTYLEATLNYFYFFIPFIILLICIVTRYKSKGVNQSQDRDDHLPVKKEPH